MGQALQRRQTYMERILLWWDELDDLIQVARHLVGSFGAWGKHARPRDVVTVRRKHRIGKRSGNGAESLSPHRPDRRQPAVAIRSTLSASARRPFWRSRLDADFLTCR
jgi:hypothetical protein